MKHKSWIKLYCYKAPPPLPLDVNVTSTYAPGNLEFRESVFKSKYRKYLFSNIFI